MFAFPRVHGASRMDVVVVEEDLNHRSKSVNCRREIKAQGVHMTANSSREVAFQMQLSTEISFRR